MTVSFDIVPAGPQTATPEQVTVAPTVVAIAGFTGRDQAAVAAHLAELAELGVPTPAATPCYYQAPPSVLTQADTVTVVRSETSGEAECVIVVDGDDAYLTLGSDHTDRAAEAIDIQLSKLLCPKPLARAAWRLDRVAERAETFELRSWVVEDDGTEVLYQEGLVSAFMRFDEIIAGIPFAARPPSFTLFCGTLPAIGGIRPARRFRAELRDPADGTAISLAYDTVSAALLDL
ncbi:MAG TPA: DUF2848 family protein [Ilumatobacter sp.]|nr:DUF2848 family protein [Ilumatobacter sp.]